MYTLMVPGPPWPPATTTSDVAEFHSSAVMGVRGAPGAIACTEQAESSKSTVYRPPVVATAAQSANGLTADRTMGLHSGNGEYSAGLGWD